MILFIDNDALMKLANYGLLDAVLAMFEVRPQDVHVLATAKYVLLPAKQRLRHCVDEEAAVALEAFLTHAKKLNPDCVYPQLLDALSAQTGIDAGESLMLALAASHPEVRVITGDKRALAALCAGKNLEPIRAGLAHRIITLEQLVLSLLDRGDFAEIQASVRSRPGVDKALTNAFGVSVPSTLDSVREALSSYVEHLRCATGDLLLPLPPSS